MNRQLLQKLRTIQLVGFDVDGVFTDGRFYLSDEGIETKAFNTQDGYGVRCLLEAGVQVAIISGRNSRAVEQRMAELGVEHVFLGCRNKLPTFNTLLQSLNIPAKNAAYVGDDGPDLPLLEAAGVSIAVANAHADIKPRCDWTTAAPGGCGAVREVCDAIVRSRSADSAT